MLGPSGAAVLPGGLLWRQQRRSLGAAAPAGGPPTALGAAPLRRGRRRPPAAPPPAAARPRRNAFVDVERDLLPDGAPNTAWRRVALRIRRANSLAALERAYLAHRHKTAVWRPTHSAGVLMRAAALLYFRLLQHHQAGEAASREALRLLGLLSPDTADTRVLRVLDGARLCQLLVVLSALRPQPGAEVVDPLVRELLREGGQKLPWGRPALLAELAAGLARLRWREAPVWLALAAAAKASLRRQQAARLGGQQQQQQQTQQQGEAEDGGEGSWADGEDELWAEQSTEQPWDAGPWQQQPAGEQQQQPEWERGGGEWGSEAGPQRSAWGRAGEWADGQLLGFDGEEEEEEGLEGELMEWEDAALLLDDADGELGLPFAEPHQVQQQQQRQRQRQRQQPGEWQQGRAAGAPTAPSAGAFAGSGPAWLSADYPLLAGALAAVGVDDPELLQLLGDEAARALPLMLPRELAGLSCAYASLRAPHEQLLPALREQLLEAAGRLSAGGAVAAAQQQQQQELADVLRGAHALAQLGAASPELVRAVHACVAAASSRGLGPGGGAALGQQAGAGAAAAGGDQLVQLLELPVLAGCPQSPLAKWACSALARGGLDVLPRPQQLRAAAAALAELRRLPEAAAAAAAVGAAATARAEDCGAAVLVEALWCCATLGCANAALAQAAAGAVGREAEQQRRRQQRQLRQQQHQQHQQHQQQRRRGQRGRAAAPGGRPEREPQEAEEPQLSSKHQAQLVWSLQQMGLQELAQQAMEACLV